MESRVGWLRGAIFAHRGFHDTTGQGAKGRMTGWVENSTSAIAGAVRFGYGVECDVQISADGVAMVFHDAMLDRLTHVQGAVADHTAAVLTRVPIAGTRDTIPTLAEALAIIGGKVPLLIEVKLGRKQPEALLCGAVVEALSGYQGQVAAMSFDPRVPKWFAREAEAIPCGLVIDKADMSGWRATLMSRWTLKRCKAEFVAVDVRGLPSEAVALWRETMPVACWTVRRDIQRELALAGADALIVEGDGFA